MSPDSGYYLTELAQYNSNTNEEANKGWERAHVDDDFVCDIKAKHPNSVFLKGILRQSENYFGYGKLIIPTEVTRRTAFSRTKYPGLEIFTDYNHRPIGDGTLAAVCSILGIDLQNLPKDYKVGNGQIAISTDPSNQNVSIISGVVIERDVYAKHVESWRYTRHEPNQAVVSAKGFCTHLHDTFPSITISPGTSGSLTRK